MKSLIALTGEEWIAVPLAAPRPTPGRRARARRMRDGSTPALRPDAEHKPKSGLSTGVANDSLAARSLNDGGADDFLDYLNG